MRNHLCSSSLGIIMAIALFPGVIAIQAQDVPKGSINILPVLVEDADGDGKPDAQDPNQIIANSQELSWSISGMTVGWIVKPEVEKTIGQTTSEMRKMLKETNFTFGIGLSGETGGTGTGHLSMNIFKVLLNNRLDGLGKINASADSSWRYNMKTQAETAVTNYSTLTSKEFISDPFVEFTVLFRNAGAFPYQCKGLTIPIMLGDKEIANAIFHEDGRRDIREFEIPAKRTEGVPYKFRARLDDTNALQLLEYITNAVPSFNIEQARGIILTTDMNSQAKEAIAIAHNIISRTTVVKIISPDGDAVSWRVARRYNNKEVTIGDAIAAINQMLLESELSQESVPVFAIEDRTEIRSISGLNNDDKGWWQIEVDGMSVNDKRYLELPIGRSLVFRYGKAAPQRNFKNFELLAQKGNPWALSTLCKLFPADGVLTKDDLETMVSWYRKAADQGDATAQFKLGTCYHFGQGVPVDEKTAAEWYRKAAEQETASAQCNLAGC